MEIDLYKGTIKGYGLDLIAYNPKNSNQYIRLNSSAPTNPLKVENTTSKKYVRLSWDGGIHCNYGDIGGWSITGDRLKDENGTIFLCPSGAANKIDIAGHSNVQGLMIKAGSGFGVTTSGALYSNSGHIGGWTINDKTLTSDTVTLRSGGFSTSIVNAIRVNNSKGNLAFSVSRYGDVTIKGDLTVTGSGSIGGSVKVSKIYAGDIALTAHSIEYSCISQFAADWTENGKQVVTEVDFEKKECSYGTIYRPALQYKNYKAYAMSSGNSITVDRTGNDYATIMR